MTPKADSVTCDDYDDDDGRCRKLLKSGKRCYYQLAPANSSARFRFCRRRLATSLEASAGLGHELEKLADCARYLAGQSAN